MAQTYFDEGLDQRATFDLFVREMPPNRNFLIACGLELALDHLEGLSFQGPDLDYLSSLGLFSGDFLSALARMRFTGDVWGVLEGEAVFAPEPILSVTAPLIEAQLVETWLLNCINFSTMIASKAARISLACSGRPFSDFSARRDHGPDAALLAARAAFIGGASSTSNVAAGRAFGLPLTGTMAHSYVLAFPDEASAFRAFARRFPASAVLLIDTLDTVEGAVVASQVAGELAAEGITVKAVRLDSGDLGPLSRQVREVLDSAGHPEVAILVSGDLDEYRIEELLASGAPIDAFGVGTQLGTSGDAPSLGGVYKLVEDARGPKIKRSAGKVNLPGAKQVYRISTGARYSSDLIAARDEPPPKGGRPMMEPVMSGGRRVSPPRPVTESASRCKATLKSLPEPLRSVSAVHPYPVSVSGSLRQPSQD